MAAPHEADTALGGLKRLVKSTALGSVKVALDAMLGVMLFVSLLATVNGILNLGIGELGLLFLVPEFLYYSLITIVLWTFALYAVVIPEDWYEMATHELPADGELVTVEEEAMGMLMVVLDIGYKAVFVTFVAGPATLFTLTGSTGIAAAWVTIWPILEQVFHRAEVKTPAALTTIVLVLMASPLVYIVALVMNGARRTPHAADKARKQFIVVVRRAAAWEPGGETLLDMLRNRMTSQPPRQR